jgi:uncharacterized delta-60 repeat protein
MSTVRQGRSPSLSAFATALVILAASSLVVAPAWAAPGELDVSFGGDGKQTIDFGGYDHGSAVAIQDDGMIVVANRSTVGFRLARFRADGSLDPAFSGDGTVTEPGAAFSARFVAIQADGKIVVAGDSGTDFALARYLADGSLDSEFAGGALTTDLGGSDYAQSVAIQADGAIAVVGSSDGDFALARYSADGGLDMSFSGDGLVTTDVGGSDHAQAVAIRGGEIVVAGVSDGDEFALARYGADGSLSGRGTVTTPLGGQTANAAAIQPDGAVVVAGAITVVPTDPYAYPHDDLAVTRYTADGALDRSFGIGGRQTADFGYGYAANDVGTALALEADGKIVVAGWTAMVDWVFTSGRDFVLARYASDGSPDASFGDGGGLITSFMDVYYDADDFILDVAIQPDGRIVATGGTTGEDWSSDAALARYHGDSVDTVAPDVTFTAGPTGTTSLASPQFAFTSSDPHASFACALHGPGLTTNPAPCASPRTLGPLADGAYTFSVRATDPAGNSTTATRSFTVAVAPDTTINSGPSGPTRITAPQFTFSASQAGATFECRLDRPGGVGSYGACASPRAYTTTVNGSYTFSVRASHSGSVDATPATRSFTVDTVAPETTITGGPAGITNSTAPSFSFAAPAGSTFACKLDTPAVSGSYAACTSPRTYTTIVNGRHRFSVRATDPAGNTDPSPATRSFTVDPTEVTTITGRRPAIGVTATKPPAQLVADSRQDRGANPRQQAPNCNLDRS